MKRFFYFMIVFIIGCSLSFGQQEDEERFIIKGKNNQKLKNGVIESGGAAGKHLKHFNAFVSYMNDHSVQKFKKKYGDQASVEKDGIAMVLGKSVDKPKKVKKNKYEQPTQTEPWGINRVKGTNDPLDFTGSGVMVCIVDTGIQKDHPDLKYNIIGGENFVSKNKKAKSSDWDDDNGHGTHISGIIGALDNDIGVVGIAPEVSLFAVKVLDSEGYGYLSDIADGILSCVENNADIINLSLGSPTDSSYIKEAIEYSKEINPDIIIVSAAGNDNGEVSYPARYEEVIAVSAMDINNQFAWFSNYGPEIDFIAPGVEIYSTMINDLYATYTGSSMAAPHVSGVVAIMISARQNKLIADYIDGLTTSQQGAGLINAFRTINGY